MFFLIRVLTSLVPLQGGAARAAASEAARAAASRVAKQYGYDPSRGGMGEFSILLGDGSRGERPGDPKICWGKCKVLGLKICWGKREVLGLKICWGKCEVLGLQICWGKCEGLGLEICWDKSEVLGPKI